jgi:hypothetical protein
LPALNSRRATLGTQTDSTQPRKESEVTRIAFIIGGILLLAGVAFAGTVTSLGSADNPPLISTTAPPTTTTTDESEQRGRENEPGEDLRGPCDEGEYASDPRCGGTAGGRVDDDVVEDRGDDGAIRSGSSGPGPSSGPSDRCGHEGGEDPATAGAATAATTRACS